MISIYLTDFFSANASESASTNATVDESKYGIQKLSSSPALPGGVDDGSMLGSRIEKSVENHSVFVKTR
jgi:hypothetical protein